MSTYTSLLREFVEVCPMSCTTTIKTGKVGSRSCINMPIDYNNCLIGILKDCKQTLTLLASTNTFFEERLKTLLNRSIDYMIKCVYYNEDIIYLADNVNLLWVVHDKEIEPVMVHVKPLFSYLFSNVRHYFPLYVKMIKPIYSNIQIGLFKFSVADWAKSMNQEGLDLPESLFLQSICFKKTQEHINNEMELKDVYYVYL